MTGRAATHGRRIHAAIRRDRQRSNLREIGVVQHERLALPLDAIHNPVRFAAGKQRAFGVESQCGHIRLAGLVIHRTLARACDSIDLALIAREISRGVAVDRILLAGFSQGGAVAYAAGLSHAAPLAGIMVGALALGGLADLYGRRFMFVLEMAVLVLLPGAWALGRWGLSGFGAAYLLAGLLAAALLLYAWMARSRAS